MSNEISCNHQSPLNTCLEIPSSVFVTLHFRHQGQSKIWNPSHNFFLPKNLSDGFLLGLKVSLILELIISVLILWGWSCTSLNFLGELLVGWDSSPGAINTILKKVASSEQSLPWPPQSRLYYFSLFQHLLGFSHSLAINLLNPEGILR